MSENVLVKVATPKGGSGFPEVLQGNAEGDIPFIKVSDMSLPGNEKYITRANNFVSRILAKEMSFTVFPKDTIVFAKVGGALLLNRRRILAGDTIIDNNMMGLIPTECDSEFLFHFMCRVDLARFVYPGVLPSVNQSTVGAIEFPSFKKAIQRRIATILTTLDEVIEATEKLVEKHQQIKAGLMHDLFTRGLWTRPELARGDHKGLPCEATAQEGQLRPKPEEAPGLYQDSPLGLIPKDWQIVTTLECASESPGSTTIGPFGSDLVSADYQSEGIPVVFVRDVKATGFEWNSEVYVSPEKAFRLSAHAVRPGDILSSKMGLPPCISCTYPDWMPDGIITADMIRLRPDLAKVTSQWLSAALNGDAFKRQVQTITAGVTRPKVTLSDFRKLRLPRPLLEEQKLIDALLTRHENVLSANHQHLAKLRQQKQGLMHDLLTGRVRVDGERGFDSQS